METLAPGKFRINLDCEKEITVSFGLRNEIYKVITKKQLEFHAATRVSLLPEELSAKLEELKVALAEAEAAETKDEAQIQTLRDQVTVAYGEAFEEIQRRQSIASNELALKLSDLTEDTTVEVLVLLLSERDETGKVQNAVTADEIRWGAKYAAYQEELLELLVTVIDYTTAALKKISGLGSLIAGAKNPQ